MVIDTDDSSINGLIFKELIKRGYSLDGDRKIWNIADSKLWYLTSEQAQAYLDLENSKKSGDSMINVEIDFLKKVMPEISDEVLEGDEITLIDIGCGDGKKAVVPINYIKQKAKITYCPIDISSYMVEKAIKNISELKVNKVVNFKWNISDFENMENVTSLLRADGKKLFLLFLGGTIGNFEVHDALYSLRQSMEDGESLLLGVPINNTSEDEDPSKNYNSKSVDVFLGHVLKGIGFKKDEIKFGTRFKNFRVECFYTIQKKKIIHFNDKEIVFNVGDELIVAVSYKYSISDYESSMKLYFSESKFFLNDEKSWALILCKK